MSVIPIEPVSSGVARQQPNIEQPPSRESILGFLNAEIARITTEQQQPGWSKWALTGALATVGWLLLSEWGAQKYNATNVDALVIGGAFVLSGLMGLAFMFQGSPNSSLYQDRVLPLRDLLGH